MREIGKATPQLAGSLLVAHPHLRDPNFRKTVLFISAFDPEQGSFGMITNRPTGKSVADFLPDKELGSIGRVPVFIGGPVGRDQLTFAAFHWDRISETMECKVHLDIEEAERTAGEDLSVVRAFIGYAGWAGGQLEAELALKSWIVRRPDPDLLDTAKSEAMWPAIMRQLGPWFRLLAEAPDDPSLN